MNTNHIDEDHFSNSVAEALYRDDWKGEPRVKRLYEDGAQCGGCSYSAPLNSDGASVVIIGVVGIVWRWFSNTSLALHTWRKVGGLIVFPMQIAVCMAESKEMEDGLTKCDMD